MVAPSFSLVAHRSVIAVGGPDRVDFLQGLISNDTTKVAPGRAIWAALLTPQGRFLNDMFVADGGDDTLLLETERERTPALAKKLNLYKLRSKVTVEDCSAAMEVAVVFGRDAEKALPIEGVTAFFDPRPPGLGVSELAPPGGAARWDGGQAVARWPGGAWPPKTLVRRRRRAKSGFGRKSPPGCGFPRPPTPSRADVPGLRSPALPRVRRPALELESDQSQPLHHPSGDRRHLRGGRLHPLHRHCGRPGHPPKRRQRLRAPRHHRLHTEGPRAPP